MGQLRHSRAASAKARIRPKRSSPRADYTLTSLPTCPANQDHLTVCHLPPGTSKWNKIEHRLFSFITINWRGKPLRSYRTIVQLIAATTTATGLKVRAQLDENKYPKGVKVSDEQLAAINLASHSVHGEWNYTIAPRRKNHSRKTSID